MADLDQRTHPTTTTGPDHSSGCVTVHETHSAYVMLLGSVAYKMKKAVQNDFLDFSTVDSRWRALDREYTLNARFAPDVYLGIAELTDPEGAPPEPLLKMRRLPESRKLSALARSGADVTEELVAIARIVARVHKFSAHENRIDRAGTREALRGRWAANIRELRALPRPIIDPAVIDEIDERSARYLAGRGSLFDLRVAQERTVDGHGDLLADDIFCMPDGPRILDCLDFADDLRYLDGLDDICCLAMDLEFLGRLDAARFVVDTYLEAACDAPPRSLVDHYIAYRATVRAKVACIRALQGCATSTADAVAHARLALMHLEAATVTTTLVGGLPGTGKSTVAAEYAARTGAVVLSSDVVRKELAGLDPSEPRHSKVGEGLYSASVTDHTYAELLRRARGLVAAGRSVVIDATWTDPSMRERARLLSTLAHSISIEIECVVPASTSLQRIATRRSSASDATRQVYEAMTRSRAPWPTAQKVSCAGTVSESVEAALAVRSAAVRRSGDSRR
ncbi:AAA family ATPase [Rhodococcus sp. NPDC006774]|uniref:bifunctional aminoglycoside phosphotransferase/ATP-binding protein n=1 Tax=Rhodococcus sp. NPDC006774 TaxID=3157186 RepID=UPI0033CEBF0B